MESKQADDAIKWILGAERVKGLDIRMHDAVEKDVAIGANERRYHRTRDRNAVSNREATLERCIPPQTPCSQSGLTDRAADENATGRNEGSAEICVKPAMQRILAAKEVISGLKVGDNLRETEHREAKMPWHRSFNRRAWPKMKRSERHRLRQMGPTKRRSAQIFRSCIAPLNLLPSREQSRQMRPEDNRTDDRCGNGCNKNRSCRDIFRIAYQRVKLGGRCVREEFESGVKSFGCPDNGDSKYDPTPISCRKVKQEAGGKHNNRGHGVNPRIVLTADHPQDASGRMPKAADAPRKLKGPGFGRVLSAGVVLHRIWPRGYLY